MKQQWQQGSLITLDITDLNTSGEGVGRHQGKVVFVPDTVTGDRARVKLTQLKSKYAKGKLQELLIASEDRIRPRCIVADKCGGCQWQHIDWEYQREVKRQQVAQALKRIGGFDNLQIEPIIYAPYALNYRNKATYPLARSATGQVQAGYYRKGTHKLINLNQCPVQDSRLHPLLKEVKQDIQQRGWSIYNETTHQGKLRHLGLRIGSRTGEMLLTLVTTDFSLQEIEKQAEIWLQRYAQLVGVCLNLNCDRTNVIFGRETKTVAGKPYLREIFAGVELHISSDTFFQVNTAAAELLLEKIVHKLNLQGTETIVDAYCGIGTFSLPLARMVRQIIGIESYQASVEQARQNAAINQIDNATFYVAKVEYYLNQLKIKPDIVMLDPPRKGCDRAVIKTLLSLQPSNIVYISCQPATLARDIKLLCQSKIYRPHTVQPADFFPQTTHVECGIVLNRIE
ncbi:23S rRNA (uracil(1939)-C(5))-methyltransferase RlmD [Myxosarcina sp. GI1]|uniref:23S rRNA (uracil(1939)-C(5))-methyltransferase RlmD n=1 Tax=Myxosarcina sp. GI1 TaxID=1541065 RepID=UPI00055A2EC9|nr:23S rRNA (uracil(1939)-C(5))-methyltransferase RlmD [Myxosarcina sp. GI1]